MPLFDLHTVGFWGMKSTKKMAETEPFTFAGERKNEKYYVE